MEGVDYWVDSQFDSIVQFDDSMGMFVPDSIGVEGSEGDDAAASVCEIDEIVEDTHNKQGAIVDEEMVVASVEYDAACSTVHEAVEVLFPITGAVDGIPDFQHVPRSSSLPCESTPRKYLLPYLNLPASGDDVHTMERLIDRDFDLNKLPIRGMFARKNDPFYEESFIQMLRLLVPAFY